MSGVVEYAVDWLKHRTPWRSTSDGLHATDLRLIAPSVVTRPDSDQAALIDLLASETSLAGERPNSRPYSRVNWVAMHWKSFNRQNAASSPTLAAASPVVSDLTLAVTGTRDHRRDTYTAQVGAQLIDIGTHAGPQAMQARFM